MFPLCKQAIYASIDHQQFASEKWFNCYEEAVLSPIDKNVGLNVRRTYWTRTEPALHTDTLYRSLSHKKWKEDQQLETHLIWITLTQTNTFDLSYQQADETNSPHSITHWGCIGDEWVVLYAFTNSFTFICTSLTFPAAPHFNSAQDLSSSEAVVQDLESMENVKEIEIPSSRELRSCNYNPRHNKSGSGCRTGFRCNKSNHCVRRRKYKSSEFIFIPIECIECSLTESNRHIVFHRIRRQATGPAGGPAGPAGGPAGPAGTTTVSSPQYVPTLCTVECSLHTLTLL